MEKKQNLLGFYAKLIVVVFSPVIVNWNILTLLFNEAINNDLLSHILMIPFLAIYIIYMEKDYLQAVILFDGADKNEETSILEIISGVILILLSFMLKLSGSITFYSLEYNVLSIPVFVSGVILIFFGFNTLKALYFPVFMLLFLVPPPFLVAQKIGSLLATYGAYLSYNLVKVIGLPAVLSMDYDTPIIYLTTRAGELTPFAIDIGCSGIYSLIGFLIFAVFISYISKGNLQNKLYIFFTGIPLLYLLNVFRITALLVVGYLYGPNFALNVFHFLGGWTLMLLGTVFLLSISEKYYNVTFFTPSDKICDHNFNDLYCVTCGKVDTSSRPPTSNLDLGKIASVLLISFLLFSIKVPIFALSTSTSDIQIDESSSYALPVSILPEIDGYDLRFVYRDTAFENISKQDASLMYQYSSNEVAHPSIWVGLEIAETRGACHPWEACLIQYAGENRVTQVDLRDISLSEDPPLTARYFAFSDDDMPRIQVILYWYTMAIFETDNGYEEKWAKISIISYVDNEGQVPVVEGLLYPFAEAVVSHWQPVSSWSSNVLAIAQDGILFINILLAGLAGVLVYSFYSFLKQKRSTGKLYDQIDEELDKNIIDVLRGLDSPSCDTIIRDKYVETIGEDIELNLLGRKLESAREMGLIIRELRKVDNEPRFVWSSISK